MAVCWLLFVERGTQNPHHSIIEIKLEEELIDNSICLGGIIPWQTIYINVYKMNMYVYMYRDYLSLADTARPDQISNFLKIRLACKFEAGRRTKFAPEKSLLIFRTLLRIRILSIFFKWCQSKPSILVNRTKFFSANFPSIFSAFYYTSNLNAILRILSTLQTAFS